MDVSVPEVDGLGALQFQVRAISNEILGKFSDVESGKEEFLTKKHELRKRLGRCCMKVDALGEQKSGILGQVGDRVARSGLDLNKSEVS